MFRKLLGLAAATACWPSFGAAQAAPEFAPVFTDGAVLQRDAPIAVWGAADPGERVTVRFGRASRSARADDAGNWSVSLPARGASDTPETLTVSARSGEASLGDILVGDVFLCSGQSNMEFQTGYATNAGLEVMFAQNDLVRLFTVPRVTAESPSTGFAGPVGWQAASSQSVEEFSAVCWFFGQDIQTRTNIPVGLIHTSWGGTRIEAWMSGEALLSLDETRDSALREQEVAGDRAAAMARYPAELRGWWQDADPALAASPAWSDPSAAATGWDALPTGQTWEATGVKALQDFDGIVWMRRNFDLTAEQAAAGGELYFGPIDDAELTYINGSFISATMGYNTPRHYSIEPGILQEGRNVLSVAVLDTGGGGGLTGAAEFQRLELPGGDSVSLADDWTYRISAAMADLPQPPEMPAFGPNSYSALFNGMIAPLMPYTLRGVLWYQGESNTNNAAQYEALQNRWIADWRAAFDADDLPFFNVQLADFGKASRGAPVESSWAVVREAQRRVADADDRVAIAVTHDIGDRYDIHPTQKKIVAQRLARDAAEMFYGEEEAADEPAPLRATRSGDAVMIDFANGPLVAYGDARPIGFELCAEQSCSYGIASVTGDSVIVSGAGAAGAERIRYCWADAPLCNLYNEDDLPAVPFEIAVD